MRILGIDPGSNATGFGVVERSGGRLVHVAHGTVRPPRGAPLAARRMEMCLQALVDVQTALCVARNTKDSCEISRLICDAVRSVAMGP